MTGKEISHSQSIYYIQVQGNLDPDWVAWFDGMTRSFDGDVTTLTGLVADQAALRGLLCKLWDLNLTLISVNREVSEDCQASRSHDNGPSYAGGM